MTKIQKYFHPITKLPAYRAATEEPAPTKGNQEVLDAVIQDFKDKAIAGTEKYGTLLETFNGRDAANDAYQELIDLVMYFKQLQLEWFDFQQMLKEYFALKDKFPAWINSNAKNESFFRLEHKLKSM